MKYFLHLRCQAIRISLHNLIIHVFNNLSIDRLCSHQIVRTGLEGFYGSYMTRCPSKSRL
jgi:hypothetical protein